MRWLRLDRVLAGTAMALVLTSGSLLAAPDTPASTATPQAAAPPTATAPAPSEADISARVPLPEPANVPPPSIADLNPATATPAPAAVPSGDGVPMPEPANVPPPSKADVTAPAGGIAAADQPIADKLNELIAANKLDRMIDRKPDRAALQAFYSGRSFAPLWIENGIATDRAAAAIARIKASAADGLDPNDYLTPDFKAAGDNPQALAEADLKLTVAVLNYARNAQAGRVHPWRVSSNIDYTLPIPDPADVLAKIVAAKDMTAALEAFNPSHPGFRALREKLAELRGHTNEPPPPRIAPGAVLKIGMKDARVPVLRERLGLTGDPADITFDKKLSEALKAYQKQAGIAQTGTLSAATVEAMNTPRTGKEIDTIIANMERWRWLPRDLGKVHVVVNIPDYTLRVMRDDQLVWTTRIVVGKPSLQTPLITAQMKYITVNPTWNVPPSIVQNEYLPALRQDPTALERIGLKVTYNRDGSVHIYQPPGERNALGRLRFNFPNRFLVYQHDTPDKNLFTHDERAYSHGCMRVLDPLKYAEVLLGIVLPKEGYTQDRIRRLFGSAEQDIHFPATSFIPVHLTYQTAYLDDAGKLVIRKDIYGHDQRLLALMRGDHRVAESTPPEPRRESTPRPRMQQPDPRQAQGPFWFFGRIFQ